MEPYIFSDINLPSQCLTNKVVLITGASKGIGRALALEVAKAGANVILVSKDLKRLEQVYDEIVAAGYPEPAIHPQNLLRLEPTQAAEMATSIKQLFGKLDAVIHNAAITGPITPLEHLSPEKWQEIIHLNLNVPYLLSYALLPLLKEADHGSLIFTTANEALHPKAYWSAYGASKAAILNLSKTLHEELENHSQVAINCINPGIVRTALRVNAYPGLDPLSFTAPEEIVPYYIYLMSETGREIKGRYIDLGVKAPIECLV